MAAFGLTCQRICVNVVFLLAVVCFLCRNGIECDNQDGSGTHENFEQFLPTVFIATLVRNKAHILPWFFGNMEDLNYPKDRIALWIRSDHNSDNSTNILKEWIYHNEHLYNSVDFASDDSSSAYPGEKGPCHWPESRFDNMMQLREQALNAARASWADFLLMVDADVLIENRDTLRLLVEQEKTIVAPMMNMSVGESYSNFWGGMNDEGYYKRVPTYFKMVGREMQGLFAVPMVHSVLLINLRHTASGLLSYLPPEGRNVPEDDIIVFAMSAKDAGVPMYILNTDFFGHVMVPLEEYHTLPIEREQFVYLQVDVLDADNPEMGPGVDYFIADRGLKHSPSIYLPPPPPKDKLGFNQIYMINLERRPERRKRMQYVLDLLGIDAQYTPAVDGKQLNDTYLYKDLKIQVVPGFTDPYGGRPMTMGEIGCFLSHYFIWEDVVEKGYDKVVVFEDDLQFEPYFRTKLAHIMSMVGRHKPDWDLIYLGRKRLNRKDEMDLKGTDSLVWPSYSYWTLSYILSQSGAKKLLAQKPLQNLLPVDEYLPVMFDQHPEESWKEPFSPRDLVALSAEPLLIYPTHYLGDPNYISDTEYSQLITDTPSDTTESLPSHNSPEEPQGPPLDKLSEQGAGLPSNNLEPSSNNNPHDSRYKTEL